MTASPKLAEGYGYLGFDELGSTSDHARDIAPSWFGKGNGPVWIHAQVQTAGRGRRGRTWLSRRGNFSATLLLKPDCTAQRGAELSFVAALALFETIKGLAPHERLQIKWPNDVLLNDKKVSGILLESAASGQGAVDWISIGCGVNLAFYPEDLPYPVTSVLAETGASAPPDQFMEALSLHFDTWYKAWENGGFQPLRAAWLERAKGLGEPLTARLANETIKGTFKDLDDTGALVLELGDQSTRVITAGEVFFE